MRIGNINEDPILLVYENSTGEHHTINCPELEGLKYLGWTTLPITTEQEVLEGAARIVAEAEAEDEKMRVVYEYLKDKINSKMWDLVYIHYDSELTDDQVSILLEKGCADEFWDDLDWASDSAYESSTEEMKYLIKDAEKEFLVDLSDYEWTDDYEELHDLMREREDGNWLNELVSNTSSPVLRVVLDDCYSYTDEEECKEWLLDVLSKHGVDPTHEVQDMVGTCIQESYSGYESQPCLVFIPSDDLDTLSETEGSDLIEIDRPQFWLSHPHSGAGWMEELPATITVKRSMIQTDESANGYSADDVFGLYRPSIKADIRKVEQ